MAVAAGRINRHHSVRGTRNGAGIPGDDRGAVFPVLPARRWGKTDVEGEYFPERLQYVAYICGMATQRGQSEKTLFSYGRQPVVHRTWKIWGGKGVSRIC